MKEANYWIDVLDLEKHPEGGYYKETYRSDEKVNLNEFDGERNLSTAIFFLLEEGNFSAFHRIKSDEMWHFYDGSPLVIHMIDEKGNYSSQKLGKNMEQGELLQFVVPAGVWFASEVLEGAFSLVGCTVSPGFDFNDFEMADATLETLCPEKRNTIQRLIR